MPIRSFSYLDIRLYFKKLIYEAGVLGEYPAMPAKKYFTEEERRKAANESKKRWRERNLEKARACSLRYRNANLEKARENGRKYYYENREKHLIYAKERLQTPEGIKSYRINNWKQRGIICENWDQLYETYQAHTNCDDCDCKLTQDKVRMGLTKCLDHDHQTGEVRAIVCHGCNIRRGYEDRAIASSQEGGLAEKGCHNTAP
jgi:hypothetical protein